jgi:hypothetical protein
MNTFVRLIGVAMLSLMIFCCHGKNTGSPGSDDDNADQKIYVTDRTGKKWDVTHAVENYGFDTKNFQYGLGPYAITPINNPEMLSPGEPGYPADSSSEAIIGLNIEGDARAYPIRTLSRHEVVNDRVGGKDVAVVY